MVIVNDAANDLFTVYKGWLIVSTQCQSWISYKIILKTVIFFIEIFSPDFQKNPVLKGLILVDFERRRFEGILKYSQSMPSNKCIVMGTLATVLRVSRIFGMAPIKLAPLRRAHPGLAPLDGYHVSASRSLRIYSYIFVTVYSKSLFSNIIIHFFFLNITYYRELYYVLNKLK